MPKKVTMKKMKKKNATINPSIDVLSYKGPMAIPGQAQDNQTVVFNLYVEGNLSSTAGSVINNVFGSGPNGSTEWGNLTTIFMEYRTLAMEFVYIPQNKFNRGTVVTRPLVAVIDRASSTALSSYTNALENPSSKFMDLDHRWGKRANMSGSEEAFFLSTGSPADVFWIKLYSDTLSASTVYGIYYVKYLVQFKGRK